MANKPKATIKNFTGMGNSGSYYLEGMSPYKLNGQTILTPSWYCNDYITEDTTGFTNLSIINGFTNIDYSASLTRRFIGIDTNELFDFHAQAATTGKGLIHTISPTACTGPDVDTTTNNNILYTSSNDLGIGRVYEATGGSTTTIVVTSINFTTLGYADGDKLYNFTNAEEYTIDTGGVGTDTLTLVTGTACADGDIFILFDDNFQDFGTTGARGDHFANQKVSSEWTRQIKLIGDEYWALNGNYISSLNVDESTFSATAKLLPYNTQAVCFDNNQGKMLVGGDQLSKGLLMLWDLSNDGWNSILEVEQAPDSIRAFGTGWVVAIQGSLYFTDGYQITLLTTYPDLEDYKTIQNVHYNGIEVMSDNIIMSADPGASNRAKTGIAIYNTKTGWEYAPFSNGSSLKSYDSSFSGALNKINFENMSSLFVSGQVEIGTKVRLLNQISQSGDNKVVSSFYIRLPDKIKTNSIGLNLSPKYSDYTETPGTVDVTVSYGDGRDALQQKVTAGTSNTTTTIKNTNGDTVAGEVGDEILVLNGDSAGERSYVTSIASGGTTGEVLTVSPAFSAAPTNSCTFNIMKLNLAETKTITTTRMPDNLMFNISNFYSDKIFIQVVMEVQTGTTLLDLHSINLW